MKTPKFINQYNKIVRAYFKNELKPLASRCCFVGNLLNNNDKWGVGRTFDYTLEFVPSVPVKNIPPQALTCLEQESNGFYSMEDICKLETIFLNTLDDRTRGKYENRLFEAMEAALSTLKELHEAKGEIVEEYNFTKRELVPA